MTPIRPKTLIYEFGMAALAVVTIVLALRPATPVSERVIASIWGVFVADYLIRLAMARGKWQFVRENWIDLIAILPVGALRIARLFRLVRVLRVVRGVSVLWRLSSTVRGILRTNELGYVLLLTVALVIAGGLLIHEVEPDKSVADGLWWSLVTSTTVGYGDVSPRTSEGRIVAAVLMLAGIGTIGMITGSIATYFMGSRRSKNPHIQHVQAQLDHWDEISPDERRVVLRVLEVLVEKPGGEGE